MHVNDFTQNEKKKKNIEIILLLYYNKYSLYIICIIYV